MADDPVSIGLFQSVVAGVSAAGLAALGWVHKIGKDDRKEIWEHLDKIRNEYVRRDDLAIAMSTVNSTLVEMKDELVRVRDRTHELSNNMQRVQGLLSIRKHENGGRPE